MVALKLRNTWYCHFLVGHTPGRNRHTDVRNFNLYDGNAAIFEECFVTYQYSLVKSAIWVARPSDNIIVDGGKFMGSTYATTIYILRQPLSRLSVSLLIKQVHYRCWQQDA